MNNSVLYKSHANLNNTVLSQDAEVCYLDTYFNDVHRPVLDESNLNESIINFNEKNYFLNVIKFKLTHIYLYTK